MAYPIQHRDLVAGATQSESLDSLWQHEYASRGLKLNELRLPKRLTQCGLVPRQKLRIHTGRFIVPAFGGPSVWWGKYLYLYYLNFNINMNINTQHPLTPSILLDE